MNFKRFLPLSLAATLIFAACSDKDTYLPALSSSKTYEGSELTTYYCGELMPAKSVTLNIKSVSPSEATLICKGITDLNQLSSVGLSGIGSGPGILPGSPVAEIPISLKAGKDNYTFEGEGNTDFLEFSYNGSVDEEKLTLNIKSAKLKNDALAGSIWKPSPLKKSGYTIESSPFHLVWEIDPALGLDFDLTGLLETIVSLPVIPVYNNTAYSSIVQLVDSTWQTMSFNENGDIFLRYFSAVGGANRLVTSVGNTLQYVVLSDQYLKLYPNPTSLFGKWLVAQSDSEGIPDISFTNNRAGETDSDNSEENLKPALMTLLKGLVPYFLNMTAEGIPMEYHKTEEALEVYLNTATLLSVMSEVMTQVAQNPEFIHELLGDILTNQQLAAIAPELQKLIPQIQNILQKTTKFEIGFSLQKYQ